MFNLPVILLPSEMLFYEPEVLKAIKNSIAEKHLGGKPDVD